MDLDDELRRLFADDRLDVPVRQDAHRAVVTRARRLRRRRRSRVVLGGGVLSVATMLLAGTAFGVGGDAPPRQPVAVPESPAVTSSTTEPPPTTTTVASTTRVVPPAVTTSTLTRTTTTTTMTSTSATKLRPPADRLAFGPTAVGGLRLGMTRDDAVATGLIQPNLTPVDAAGCQGYDWSGHANAPAQYSVLFSPKYGLVQIGGRTDAVTPEGVYAGSSEAEVRALYPAQAQPHDGSLGWVTPVPGNPNARYWFVIADHMVADMRLELAVQDCYR